MREILLKCLLEAARQDERLLLLTGDHGYALFDEFRKALPERFLNCGIAEQNMIGVASGMAKSGLRPIVYGLSAFIPMRVLEQIKLDICYENRPVLLLGDGAGLVYAPLGVSHQCCEDVAALRSLQGMTILSPADRWEAEACARLALASKGPVYLRMGKSDVAEVHKGPVDLGLGELLPLQGRGNNMAWLATGSMVHRACEAARHFPGSRVWSVPCLQPIDEAQVRSLCSSCADIVTVEVHSTHGGGGSIVAEIAAEIGQRASAGSGSGSRFWIAAASTNM